MVNKEVSIELIQDLTMCIGICIDLSNSVERSIVMFDALLADKVNSICFFDSINKIRSLVYKGQSTITLGTESVIMLSECQIDAIKDMLLNVSIGNAFAGYHYDFEFLQDIPIDLSFILKK